ncbi:MAG TPA: AtpZ/AtpI family protein [Pyrinomonadaceae bacterium]|nr:AtpZ/AtpI family protein [Pyrinomonadaceae bacterium]
MIKNLLGQDEYQPREIKTEREETTNDAALEKISEPQYIEVNEAEILDAPETSFDRFDEAEISLSEEEIESINSFVETTSNPNDFSESRQFNASENLFAETTNEADYSAAPIEIINETENSETASYEHNAEIVAETVNHEPSVETRIDPTNFELPASTKIGEEKPAYDKEMLFQPLAEPESFAETARKSGLAYAAAITLFASIVFMLVIGWFADLLFGSSPWGIVGGIIFGSLIGFVQFFRMTAQILRNKD